MTLEEAEYFRTKGLVALKLILLLIQKKGVTFSEGEYEELRNAVDEIFYSVYELAFDIGKATIREKLQQIKEEEIKEGGEA